MQRINKLGFRSTLVLGALVAMGTQIPLSAATTLSATSLRAVKVVRETAATTTASTVWVNVPGATTTVTIPALTTDLILAQYTAESVCFGASGWCPVRILLNGVEMDPASGTDFAFDSSDGGAASPSSWESHAVQRSRAYTNSNTFPVSVTIQVQYMTTVAGMTFRLDDWHLTVQQFH
jgi:hypothetical protein